MGSHAAPEPPVFDQQRHERRVDVSPSSQVSPGSSAPRGRPRCSAMTRVGRPRGPCRPDQCPRPPPGLDRQSCPGLGREGQARFVADLALRREGAADDGLDLAVGGHRVNCLHLGRGEELLSYQAPFSVKQAAVAPSSPKDISIWSAVSSVLVLRGMRVRPQTLEIVGFRRGPQ